MGGRLFLEVSAHFLFDFVEPVLPVLLETLVFQVHLLFNLLLVTVIV